MDKDRKKEIMNKMIEISSIVDAKLNEEIQERKNIIYYEDFEFGKSGLAEKNVYIVEISNQKQKETGDKGEKTTRKEKAEGIDGLEKDVTYEIYSEDDQLIAIVTAEGKVQFTQEYLEQLKAIDEKYFEQLNLDDIDFELPEELRENDLVMTKEETEETRKEDSEEKERKSDNKEQQESNQDEEQKAIAEQKGIPQNNVLKIRENSNFYKDHPNLEPNLIFYIDNDGIARAEYIDENGNLQPSKYFEPSQTSLRQETVDIGNDGNPVVKEVPYQVMKTNGLASTDKDIRDVRININRDTYGYIEISEARQGKNGKWAAHNIEVKGRDYNSREVNEQTSMRTRVADPDKQTDAYAAVEETGLIQDEVQYDEMYLMEHSEEIIEEFMKEGYNKDEAIAIFDYMIGEETLPEEEAKQRVNEEIKEAEKQRETSEEKEAEQDDEERTPWGDAESRRSF